MRTKRTSAKAVTLIIAIITAVLFVPGMVKAGSLEPTAPPGPTMKTLEDIYQKLSAMESEINILKALLTNGSRFVDNNNGTVTDSKTGLVWLKNANPCGSINWTNAMAYCSSLASGQAGLTDGSVAGQWRLPSKEELEGIGTNPPSTWDSGIPSVTWTTPGTPFTNITSNSYWSGTSYEIDNTFAFQIGLLNGNVVLSGKSAANFTATWPVRGGK